MGSDNSTTCDTMNADLRMRQRPLHQQGPPVQQGPIRSSVPLQGASVICLQGLRLRQGDKNQPPF